MMALASKSLLVITVLLTFNDLLATTPPSRVYYDMCDVPNNTVQLYPSMNPFYISSNTSNNGTYENNERCTLAMTTSWQPVVLTFNYTFFYLEYQSNCSYDYLCVYGVKYCGSWLTEKTFTYIVQPFSSFTVVFRTDGSVVLGGFKIRVTAERAPDQRITIADGGVGSNAQSVNVSTVTYSPEYQYTDRCVSAATTAGPGTTTGRPDLQTTSPLERGTTSPSRVYYDICDVPNNTVQLYPSMNPFYISSHTSNNGTYENNERCTLAMTTSWQPVVLTFNYTSFDLEYQSNCSYDYLCVYGVKYCGSWLTGKTFTYIVQPFSSFTVVFRTDGSVVLGGFQIRVTAERAPDQRITIADGGVGSNSQSVNVSTVTYSQEYQYTDRCVSAATTAGPGTTTVRPDLQTTSPLDRGTTSSQEVHYFCNDYQSNVVNINAGSAPLLIFSPYYWRGSYNNNTFCSLVLKSGPEPLIVSLNYTQFDLEMAGRCYYDYLCVHGVIFCGNFLAGDVYQYVLPANSELTLVFKTDSSVVRRGFEIQVSQERAIGQSITEAVGGVGDFNQNVVYKNLTFPTNEPYKDECAQLYNTNSPGAAATAAYTSNDRTTRSSAAYTSNDRTTRSAAYTSNYRTTSSSAAYTSNDRTTSASCLTNVNEIRAEISQAVQLLNRVLALLPANTEN